VQWLAQTADVRFHHEIKARPIDRFQEEKPHLLSLPARPLTTSEDAQISLSRDKVGLVLRLWSIPLRSSTGPSTVKAM
jgi:hypothetical protein